MFWTLCWALLRKTEGQWVGRDLSSRSSQSRRERGMRTQGYNVASSLLQSKGHGNRGRKGNQASLRIREGSPEGEGFRLQLNRKGFNWEGELETEWQEEWSSKEGQERACLCWPALSPLQLLPVSSPLFLCNAALVWKSRFQPLHQGWAHDLDC